MSTTGTSLPPNLLLCAKLIILSCYRAQVWQWFPGPFIPFVPALEMVGPPRLFKITTQIVFLVAATSLLFNFRVRTACLVLGTSLLVGTLSSRPHFHNFIVFTGLVLVLIGLYESRQRWPLVRFQVPLVYFGAALNKVMEPDWRSGQFFENWILNVLHYRAYARLSSLFPPLGLSATLDWLAIITEFALAFGFLFRRTVPWAITIGIAWHSTLLLLTGRTFGIFYYAMLFTYLVFLEWPDAIVLRFSEEGLLKRRFREVLMWADVDHRLHWISDGAVVVPSEYRTMEGSNLATRVPCERVYSGDRAYFAAAAFTPFTYFAVAALAFVFLDPAARRFAHLLAILH